MCLDALTIHFKVKHRDTFSAEGRSLLGFRVTSAAEAGEEVEAVPIPYETTMIDIEPPERHETVGALTEQPPPRQAEATQ